MILSMKMFNGEMTILEKTQRQFVAAERNEKSCCLDQLPAVIRGCVLNKISLTYDRKLRYVGKRQVLVKTRLGRNASFVGLKE